MPSRRLVNAAASTERYHEVMPPKISDPSNSSPTASTTTAEKFCILGAGSSGLAVAKNFRELGIPFDCLECEDDVGGNWYYGRSASSVYRSTRLISSKPLTEYTDFPMPDYYPDHPDQEMVWRYLRSYAQHFQLYSHIEFNTRIDVVAPAADATGCEVSLASGERRRYRGVVIANGHNWDPRWPNYPGSFDGEVIHSSQYKTPDLLVGRRVLVVGGGNSGYDIATESARHADATFHSLRRRYPLLPRFFRGQPVDQGGEWMLRWRLPLWLRRRSIARVCRLAWSQYLPLSADHAFFETHPAINGRWPLDVARGAIVTKPDIRELQGQEVIFGDGTRENVDVIVYATGFKFSFPFLDIAELNWQNGRPALFLNVFHPDRDDLFVVGLIQPDSGQFGLVDRQAQLVAAYLKGLKQNRRGAARLQAVKRNSSRRATNGIRYVDSPRHLLEVEHFSYRRALESWLRYVK
jgi:cation diffusion facilitator CzcD-associated flavoprotein CzcO